MAAVATTVESNRRKEVQEFDDSKIGVKGLLDSGITTIPKFFVHPSEILSTLKPSPTESAGIPVVDLSGKDSAELRPKIVGQIREAASTWGFFQVINHGVAVSVMNKTVEAVKSFHDLPGEVKAEHYGRRNLDGFTYTSNNDLFQSNAASWHDFIHVCMSPDILNAADKIPEVCREQLVEWDRHTVEVGEAVAELLSEGLGLAAGRLKEEGLLVTRTMGSSYYPYCPQPELTLGFKDHTDPGVLTVLLENNIAGLQVKHAGEWVDVRLVPGSLIINIGDTLQIVSNGAYRSVEHRVLANSLKEPRISIAEFFLMDKRDESRQFGPLPELISPRRRALYRTFTVKDFDHNFFSKALDSKSLVDRLML